MSNNSFLVKICFTDLFSIFLDTSSKSSHIANKSCIFLVDLFELVMALEEEYDVDIPSEDLTNLNTVGDVINYLKNKGVED